MAAGYKEALKRFERAVLGQMDGTVEADREYEEARRVLVGKLNYRQLTAEERARTWNETSRLEAFMDGFNSGCTWAMDGKQGKYNDSMLSAYREYLEKRLGS